jgi:hypothetical protein
MIGKLYIPLKLQNNDFNNLKYYGNSIQFFIIYVPSQQPQGQLQTQHSVDRSNYLMDNIL